MYRASAAAWFSAFLLKPLVRRVQRRSCIRVVRLNRSMNEYFSAGPQGLPIGRRRCKTRPRWVERRRTSGMADMVDVPTLVTGAGIIAGFGTTVMIFRIQRELDRRSPLWPAQWEQHERHVPTTDRGR